MRKVCGSVSGVGGKFAGSGWEVPWKCVASAREVSGKCAGSVWEVPWECVGSAREVLVEDVLEVCLYFSFFSGCDLYQFSFFGCLLF